MDFKNTLRKKIDRKLASLSEKEKTKFSEQVTTNITESNLWLNSKEIFIFISFKDEVETDNIIKRAISENKKVYTPLISKDGMKFFRIDNIPWDNLVKSRYGILEPPKGLPEGLPTINSIMLTPGVAFTPKGERLGRGRGYYDKYLSLYPQLKKIALTFSIQMCDEIPTESWDIKMDYIVTEEKIYGCN